MLTQTKTTQTSSKNRDLGQLVVDFQSSGGFERFYASMNELEKITFKHWLKSLRDSKPVVPVGG